jgi:GPH family glycoside/pentoside/hexuronide:cation symporter
MVLLATCFVQGIGQASDYTVLGIVFLYALQAIWLVPVFIVVMVVFSGISQPIWLALSRRWGKHRTYVVFSVPARHRACADPVAQNGRG